MYNLRDLRGHWTLRGTQERPCLHKCCAGKRAHPEGVFTLPDRHVLRAMSDEEIRKNFRWDNEVEAAVFLGELDRRDQADARRKNTVQRRKDKAARENEEHQLAIEAAYRSADQATRGHMLSPAGRAAGVDPRSLFSGSGARARKYASEELRGFWDDHGGRMTLAEYRRHLAGERAAYEEADRSREARKRRRQTSLDTEPKRLYGVY